MENFYFYPFILADSDAFTPILDFNLSTATSAAFSPDKNMPLKVGPILGLP